MAAGRLWDAFGKVAEAAAGVEGSCAGAPAAFVCGANFCLLGSLYSASFMQLAILLMSLAVMR